MRKEKEKEKKNNPILYQKYKQDHHLNEEPDVIERVETKRKFINIIRHVITVIILVIMILLSTVGVITILNGKLSVSWLALALINILGA